VAEVGVGADAAQAVVCGFFDLFDGARAEVGQLAGFEVAPDALDGVKLMRVAGEAFDPQSGALLGDPGGHLLGGVRRQRVPDQGELAAVEEVVELGEELDERVIVVGAGAHVEDEFSQDTYIAFTEALIDSGRAPSTARSAKLWTRH
jgi:hypothetical protein